jgi:hypothetical protein
MKTYTYYYLSYGSDIAFYVGKTTADLKTRLSLHKCDCNTVSYNKDKSTIIENNLATLTINEIETIKCHEKKSIKIETYWIHQFHTWGFTLTNKVGMLKKRKDKKQRIKKKGIQITEEVHKKFISFCKKRHMIVTRSIELAMLDRMNKIIEHEKRLRVA